MTERRLWLPFRIVDHASQLPPDRSSAATSTSVYFGTLDKGIGTLAKGIMKVI
jgi:hypothetical protein